MRLKIYRASRMAEAIAMVRAELGEDAVILGSRRVAEGVEVTAALEPPEPVIIPPDPPRAAVRPAGPPSPLARHNLPPALVARLEGEDLPARLAASLGFAPLPEGLLRPLLLAGPPGAGKTLTCAKLATRAVMDGLQPLVVSTDAARAGATEQLAAFTRLLGLPLALAAEPGTLVKALGHRLPGQPILIDSAGCNPFEPGEARALLTLARAVEAELVVVLPAGLDAAEASDLARSFALLGARHLLPTRLDQARRLGAVLSAAAAGLALTEAGIGPAAAEGLAPITPQWLAARLLGQPTPAVEEPRP